MKYPAFVLMLSVVGGTLGWFAVEPPVFPVTQPHIAVDETPRVAPAPAPVAVEVSEPSVAELLSNEFRPVERRGEGTIHGTVTDRQGKPQPGVVLIAEPVLAPAGESLPARIRRHREFEARLRQEKTAAGGRYVFDDLPDDGVYTIRDRRGRILPMREFRPGDTADFQVDPFSSGRRSVTVRVTLDGQVLPRARLQIAAANQRTSELGLVDGGTQKDWLASEPEVQLWIGAHRMRAFLDGEYASDVVTVEENHEGEVELELRPCTSIFGRLELPPGPEYARLFATRLDPGQSADEVELLDERLGFGVRHGGFKLIGVTPGRYAFGLALGQSGIVHTWEAGVEEGLNSLTLSLEELPDDGMITITVTDPEGRGMAVERFSYSAKMASGGTRSHAEAPVMAEGNRYHVRLGSEEIDAVENGREVTVSVRDERWSSQTIELVRGRTDYAITYPPQSQLDVVLTDYLGSGFEGAVDVSVVHESEANDMRRSVSWDEEFRPDWLGDCRFENLKPGPNLVIFRCSSVESANGSRGSVEWDRRPIILHPGPNRLETALPVLYTLQIEFPDALRGEKIRLSRINEHGNSESIEDDRVVRRTVEKFHVPAGEYSVYMARQRMRFRVATDTRVAFEQTRFTAMRLRVREESPLRALGFRHQDIVVAIDGKPFADPYPSQILWGRIEENGRATVTVLREEGEIDLAIDRDSLGERRNLWASGVLDPRTIER